MKLFSTLLIAFTLSTVANAQVFRSVYDRDVFQRTCTITSAAGGTAVHCLAAADIPTGKKAYLTNWLAKVNGGTLWGTVTSCSIQDSAASPVSLVQIPVADLAANAVLGPHSANLVLGSAYSLGTGATLQKGLDIKCNATGTGSDLVVTVSGVIK